MIALSLLALSLLALSLLASSVTAAQTDASPIGAPGQTAQVVVPLRLDYPLLQQLLIAQLFTGAGETRELLNDPSGCSEILLSAPALASRDSQLEFLADVQARIGVGSPGACASMLNWRGRIGIGGSPEIREDGTVLGFSPARVWLLDPAGQPVNNVSLQALAEASVRAAFGRFVVDLKPQLRSVADFLPAVLPRHSREQIEALLGTLRVTRLQLATDTLNADMSFTIEPLSEPLKPEHALTDAELARWEERWQLMDSLLVFAVKHYAAATQLQELRDALLDALIESRYRLRDALTETPGSTDDSVRSWFLQSWQALTPILRRIGVEQPGQEHLLLLSVIAATDALETLDQLGPDIGLDVSTDGLRRLARLINGSAGDQLLQYSEDVDPQLRRLLEERLGTISTPSAWHFELNLFPPAFADDAGRLNSWAPKRQDLPEYLPMVAVLLDGAAQEAGASRKLDPAYQSLFRNVVLTTAWQESCWRHYVISDERKLVPLRSGTGDVGLMQINERVWRGFYDQQRLRWDIDYNVAAGAEVLVDYLVKYAIRKGEHRQPGGIANLARASYSAYNGGPSRLSRYRSDRASAYGKKVDALFWEKYQQVASGNELAVSRCLGGDLSGPAVAGTRGSAARAAENAAPDSGQLTLQLAAFSSEKAARAFISQHGLQGTARVRTRSTGNSAQYVVLYGSYGTRAEAERARKNLDKLQPWIRRLSDL